MERFYRNTEYTMLIDFDQVKYIDNVMKKSEDFNKDDVWAISATKFLKKYNARLGQIIKSYNPYIWREELIFNTEQDAIKFCLKVL